MCTLILDAWAFREYVYIKTFIDGRNRGPGVLIGYIKQYPVGRQ